MLMITGILKGYSETEFIDELIRMNNKIQTELNIPNINAEIKVIAIAILLSKNITHVTSSISNPLDATSVAIKIRTVPSPMSLTACSLSAWSRFP